MSGGRDPERLEERVGALDDKIKKTQRRANKSRLKGREELRKVRNLDDDFPFHKHEDDLHPSQHLRDLSTRVDKAFHEADDKDSIVQKLMEERQKLILGTGCEQEFRRKNPEKELARQSRDLKQQAKRMDVKDGRKVKVMTVLSGSRRPLPDLSRIEQEQIRQIAEDIAFEEHYMEKLAGGSHKKPRKGKQR